MRGLSNRMGFLSISNWLHLVGAVVLLLVLILAGAIPAHLKGRCMAQRVQGVEATLAEHMALVPFHAELQGLADEICEHVPVDVASVPLGREEFAGIHNLLAAQAQPHGLRMGRVVPQVVTVSGSRYLCARIMVEGAFAQIPLFVRDVMAWPSFFCLDQMTISQGDGGEVQLEVVLWLSVRQQGEDAP